MGLTVLDNIINSVIASGVSELVTLPLCTIKTHCQNANNSSIKQTVKKIYRSGGFFAFYRASVPAISSQIFSTSFKYTTYRYLNDTKIISPYSIVNSLVAGVASTIITHPLDTVKIHLQMNTPFLPQIKKHGFSIFYRGYSKTLSKICISSCLFFPLYDFTNSKLNNAFTASVITSIISTTIMHPLDYLKTRHIYGLQLYQGLNPRVYYTGLSVNLLRIIPNFTIIMMIIDFLEKNRCYRA